MKIYTKTGDEGKTSLYGGKRVNKDNIRIEAYGTIDELNSNLGLLISSLPNDDPKELLFEIQKRLFAIGSILASDPSKDLPTPDIMESDIELMENSIDNMEETLEPLKTFILPGGSQCNSIAHVCRTVARRAERRVITLSGIARLDPIVIKYLNRLSDYFFVLSRKIAQDIGHSEIPWTPRS